MNLVGFSNLSYIEMKEMKDKETRNFVIAEDEKT